jgi:hypothetical protein
MGQCGTCGIPYHNKKQILNHRYQVNRQEVSAGPQIETYGMADRDATPEGGGSDHRCYVNGERLTASPFAMRAMHTRILLLLAVGLLFCDNAVRIKSYSK